jgi:chaperonin GroEL
MAATYKSSFAVGKRAQETLRQAIVDIAEAVGSTLGPGGRPFGYDKLGVDHRLTAAFSKDGLTVLRALHFDSPPYQAALQYCRQAAFHSVTDSGDGTTSTTILANAVAQAIFDSGHKYPQAYARMIEKDAERAIECIRKEAIKTPEAVRKVALTSTNGDTELTEVVLEAINHSSAYGTILVNKIPDAKARYAIKKQDGYANTSGYSYNETFALSADSAAASSKPIEWYNPDVLIFNGHLMQAAQITPIMQQWGSNLATYGDRKLVIMCFDVSDEVCNNLMVFNRNNARNGNAVFIVRPKMIAEPNGQLQIMRDISSFCGIDDQKIVDGGNLRALDASFFGTCGSIKIGHSSSTWLGRAKNHWVEKRILQNQSIAESAKNTFDKEMCKTRSAELAEGLVTVEIGDGMWPDLQERADRFDDASKAAKACMASGALPGSGCSYIRAAHLAQVNPGLANAMRSVYETVLSNYGCDSIDGYLPKPGEACCISSENGVFYGDAFENSVLDSCETVCGVIKNGVALGVKIATIGGYLYRNQDFEDVHIVSM